MRIQKCEQCHRPLSRVVVTIKTSRGEEKKEKTYCKRCR